MALPQITWQDVQQTPDDGNRYEAIEGDLHVTPPPRVRHQRVSSRLERALHALLEDGGHGEVLHAPVGVEFPATGEGVQPDILFVSNARRGIIAEDWLRGAPDLVVEILSPTTASRDRGLKRRLYERQGVAQYWIVDAEANAVEVWRFEKARDPGGIRDASDARDVSDAEGGARHERFTGRLPVRLGDRTVGEIDLEAVFHRD